MRVKELMHQAIVVEKDITLAEAAKLMSDEMTDSLLLASNGKLKGIVTQRDVLKHFGKSARISDIMSSKLVTITPQTTVNDALAIMKEKKIKRLPVVSGEKLAGIVSLTDIAAHVDELEGDFFFE